MSLDHLPVELRMEIWNHLFNVNHVPLSYGYTGLPARAMPLSPPSWPVPHIMEHDITQRPARDATMEDYQLQLYLLEAHSRKRFRLAKLEQEHHRRTGRSGIFTMLDLQREDYQLAQPQPPKLALVTRTHSMIIVSKELSAEYRQAYYNRTHFFLRIDLGNVLRGIPHLRDGTLEGKPQPPNFWNTPSMLFANLRHCTLYTELGDIEKGIYPDRLHEQGALKDTRFDTYITRAVLDLLATMQQLRSIHIVWATPLAHRIPNCMYDNPEALVPLLDAWNHCTVVKTTLLRDYPPKHSRTLSQAVAAYNAVTFLLNLAQPLCAKKSLQKVHITFGDADLELEYKSALRSEWCMGA